MGIRLFISYASQYQAEVDALVADLKRRGADVWVAPTGIRPGDVNYQAEIDRAIQRAAYIIYIASPEAQASNFVYAELDYARIYAKLIIPLWISGDQWVRCAPMELSRSQYIDARGSKWPGALEQLAQSMGLTTASRSGNPVTASILQAMPSPPYQGTYPNVGNPPFIGVLSDNVEFQLRHRRQKSTQLILMRRPQRGQVSKAIICGHCGGKVIIILRSQRRAQLRLEIGLGMIIVALLLSLIGSAGIAIGAGIGYLLGPTSNISQLIYVLLFIAVVIVTTILSMKLLRRKFVPLQLLLRWLLPLCTVQEVNFWGYDRKHELINLEGTSFSDTVREALQNNI